MSMTILQYLGVALGLLGAVLVSSALARHRRRGFGLWIASNACLIAWAVSSGAWGLLAMYAVYSATSVMGWRNQGIVLAQEHHGVDAQRHDGAALPAPLES